MPSEKSKMIASHSTREKCVAEYMTRKVFTIRSDKKMIAVKSIMDWAHIRHVPVVSQAGKLVGMLSHRDLLMASLNSQGKEVTNFDGRRHLWSISIKKIMHSPVFAVRPLTSIAQAARIMRNRRIGALPVVEKNKLVGIITEHDLLGVLEEALDRLPKMKVKSV